MATLIERAERIAQKQAKAQYDIDNADWLNPLRDAFHAYLSAQGWAAQKTPPPGCAYNGSHTQAMWECWLAASQYAKANFKEFRQQALVDALGDDA